MKPPRADGRLGLAAILSILVAYGVMAQGPGWNQNAHYALIRSLSDGTATIDRARFETGKWYPTGDITLYKGHYYATKAPGLAFASLPAYLPLKGTGVWNSGDSTRMLWFRTLWTVVLPAGILLLLVRRVADRAAAVAVVALALPLVFRRSAGPLVEGESSRA